MNSAISPPAGPPWAIEAHGLGKAYAPRSTSLQRLRAALSRGDVPGERFWALRDLSLQVGKGEALGVIGRNGAGKSTLLQMLCGTVAPTTGHVAVNGRVAALLELGAGFNLNFTGRENVLLNGPLMGLSREELEARLDAIIDFSGIGAFIDQPVKTYSSGMFVRLAFSLATSVEPDILVVDEALSVGDGEFARKSFDRIMAMKERGTTILFCSHALYQVTAFCDRVLWLQAGQARELGEPHQVVRAYELFLAGEAAGTTAASAQAPSEAPVTTPGHARISRIRTSSDGLESSQLRVRAGQSSVRVEIEFESDPALPPPTAGISIELPIGMPLSVLVTRTDGVLLQRDAAGRGRIAVEMPRIALRRGEYRIDAYLGHEDAVHLYDSAIGAATLHVEDALPEPGLVTLDHEWHAVPGHRE